MSPIRKSPYTNWSLQKNPLRKQKKVCLVNKRKRTGRRNGKPKRKNKRNRNGKNFGKQRRNKKMKSWNNIFYNLKRHRFL
jgi:hypothetical protein